jgi:hypothetical protein
VTLALGYGKPVILFGPEKAFYGFPPGPPRTAELTVVREFVLSALSGRG